jgi:multiple sugar transport system permease protein
MATTAGGGTPPVAVSSRRLFGRRRRRRLRRDTAAGMLMAAPAVIGLMAFVAVPFAMAVVLSFYNAHLNSPRPAQFFGLEQYRRLFTDPQFSRPFFRALLNNLIFAAVVVPLQTGLALALALLLNRRLRGMAVFRTFFFMPVVFPMALVAVIWRLILDRGSDGLLNTALAVVTLHHASPHDWLGSGATAMLCVIVLSIWQGVGFQMVIILAGLQHIPTQLYEAAALDRANRWQQFRYITVPALRNTLIFVAMVTSILAFRVFDQVYILTKAGGLNEYATQTLMYQAVTTAFDEDNIGRASAITVLFFLIVVTLTLVQRLLLRHERASS